MPAIATPSTEEGVVLVGARPTALGLAIESATTLVPGKPVLLVRDERLLAALGQALEPAVDEIVLRRLPILGSEPLDAPRALLVRPDGRIAWTAPADGPIGRSLETALRAVGFPLPELPAPVAAR